MSRYAHFVGSLPSELMAGGERAVLDWFAEHGDGHPLTGLPCDLDPDWIIAYLRDRAEHADVLEVLRPGEFGGYADFPTYGVRAGRTLEPRHVSMDRLERIGSVVEAFEALQRDRPELAGAKLQISQPHPLDLAMFVFAGGAVAGGLPVGLALRRSKLMVAALRNLPVFTEAIVAELTEIRRRHGDRIVVQIESPFTLLSMVKAQELHAVSAMAPVIARQLAGFLAKVHEIDRVHQIDEGTVVHLCYGDYQHESLLSPRDLTPAVQLLNRTATLLRRREVPLPPVHIPCAYGANPAPLDVEFYAPLRTLDRDWRIIAGVVSPNAAETSADALTVFEKAAGGAVHGVAAACGLGRCSVDTASAAAATTVALARA